MSNEEKIIDRIKQDAKTEAEKYMSIAKAEADELILCAKDKAQKELSRLHALSLSEAEKAAAKEISGAQMDAKKKILSEKQRLLEEVIAEAQNRLLNLNDEQYEKVISQMLDKAENAEGSVVVVSEKDRQRIGSIVQSKGRKLSDETSQISGGFIIKKGDIEYNYSFESIIMVERGQIEQIAAEILFQ